MKPEDVIPAKAGIQNYLEYWIPVCTGMTKKHLKTLFQQLAGGKLFAAQGLHGVRGGFVIDF
jgi:hypothetical protein